MTTYHQVVEPDIKAALDFLRALYANTNEDGWLNLFHVDKRTGGRVTAWAPLEGMESLGRHIAELAPRGDVWFSVAPRKQQLGEGRRGGVKDCVSIPALWLDIDIASDVHKLPGLPTSYEQGRQLALSLGLAPSAVVRSGYGLQVWWILRESIPAQEAPYLLRRWQLTWQRLADVAGVHLDNTSNIDRVMRLPGTFNFKGLAPLMVTCKSAPRLYESSDMGDVLDVLAPSEAKANVTTSHLAGSRFNEATDIRQMLTNDLHCTLVRSDGEDEHYHYPKSQGETSCTLYGEDKHVTIWSETMAADLGLEVRRPYDPFGLWAAVRFAGDFGLAHAVLVEHGITDMGSPRAPQPSQPEKPSGLVIVTHADVEISSVEWLWYRWLPAGKLCIFDGDPDAGKSTMSLDLASRISTGKQMPDGSPGIEPASVLLLAAEDDMSDTVGPRLRAAGADLRRVHQIKTAFLADEEMAISLPRDTKLMEAAIRDYGARLVIVDVMDEYIDERVDTHKNSSVRKALQPVRDLAERSGAAFIFLRHYTKEGKDRAIYRGGGSIGIIGAARAGWAIGYHPEDEAVRVLAVSKMNLAPHPQALAFMLMPHASYDCAFVDWRGTVELSADQLLTPGRLADQEERQEKKTKGQQCAEALVALLSDGDMWSNELFDAVVKDLGVSRRTYDEVKARLTFAWPQKMPDGTKAWRVRLRGEGDG